MLTTFSGYRMAFCRQVYKNLRSTSMQTFFKVCPKELVIKHDETFGITILINGSIVFWFHLDSLDEATAKGLEINSMVIDQAEEVSEEIYLLMDSRIGRWDKAKVPDYLLTEAKKAGIEWPRHPKWGHHLVPNYVDILDNPSEDDFHWTSRFFDDDSTERIKDCFNIIRKTDDDLNDPRTIAKILTRDPTWVDKYYYGKKVVSGAMVHKVPPECIIDLKDIAEGKFKELLFKIRNKASLYRVLDHGETAPTCCLWGAAVNGIHILFGEYYLANEVISYHRKNIYDISIQLVGDKNLENFLDYADPSIFKKELAKRGGRTNVAYEYFDTENTSAPPIYWSPADNNEMATRNRINELLRPSSLFKHPITDISPAPGIYFVLADTEKHPHGIHNILIETKKQRKELLGEVNGRKYYSDDRDKNVSDHGYDTLRYYVAVHGTGLPEETRIVPKRSFANFNRIWKLRKAQLAEY